MYFGVFFVYEIGVGPQMISDNRGEMGRNMLGVTTDIRYGWWVFDIIKGNGDFGCFSTQNRVFLCTQKERQPPKERVPQIQPYPTV